MSPAHTTPCADPFCEADNRLLQCKAYKSMQEAIEEFSENKEEVIAENTIDKLMKLLEDE